MNIIFCARLELNKGMGGNVLLDAMRKLLEERSEG